MPISRLTYLILPFLKREDHDILYKIAIPTALDTLVLH